MTSSAGHKLGTEAVAACTGGGLPLGTSAAGTMVAAAALLGAGGQTICAAHRAAQTLVAP